MCRSIFPADSEWELRQDKNQGLNFTAFQPPDPPVPAHEQASYGLVLPQPELYRYIYMVFTGHVRVLADCEADLTI